MNPKLLIVDDESDVLDFAASFFRKRKVDVLTASSGEEALEVINREDPAAMLLDIKMEGMDGIETLKRIKEFNKEIKVIMVTGRDDEETMRQTQEMGAYGYIHKPLKLDELEKVVMQILEKAK